MILKKTEHIQSIYSVIFCNCIFSRIFFEENIRKTIIFYQNKLYFLCNNGTGFKIQSEEENIIVYKKKIATGQVGVIYKNMS